jgi:hypothetical protein
MINKKNICQNDSPLILKSVRGLGGLSQAAVIRPKKLVINY